jgi:hypothetical protein
MDSLEALREWLPETLQDTGVFGVAAIYKRGATEISVTAILGQREFAPDADGMLDRVKSRSFDILVSALTAIAPPVSGDTILADITGAGSNQTYTVGTPPGEPVYIYADEPFRLWYRIRTQE